MHKIVFTLTKVRDHWELDIEHHRGDGVPTFPVAELHAGSDRHEVAETLMALARAMVKATEE